MGISAHIQATFAYSHSPKDILKILIKSGWTYSVNQTVSFLAKEGYPLTLDLHQEGEWKDVEIHQFNLEEFLDAHKNNDTIGIILTTADGVGGPCFFSSKDFYLGISFENIYLFPETKTIDFNFYLKALQPLLKIIQLESLSCNISFVG